jgi:general secretion pathway protein K
MSNSRNRGSILIIVIWAIAVLAVIVGGTQVICYRMASVGAKNMEQIQARWAARAGVEQVIAVLSYHLENPDSGDALAILRDLEDTAVGETKTGNWEITHVLDGQLYLGPMDESSKININTVSVNELMELDLDGLSQDVVDAIVDWRDEDDEVSLMGAEDDFYRNRNLNYEPRNSDLKSIAEMELIAGVWPESLRGADTRLINNFDPEAALEPGWSQYLTAYTSTRSLTQEGLPRFRLDNAEESEIAEYFGLTSDQSASVKTFASSGSDIKLESILAQGISDARNNTAGISSRRTGLSTSGSGNNEQDPDNSLLSLAQHRMILDEGWVGDLAEVLPGRVNVNTASLKALETVFSFDPTFAEDVITLRSSREGGITSIVDLLETGRITPEILGAVGHRLTTTGTVYAITSRGRSVNGDIETAMFVVVDRSSLPIQILEYREE